MLEELSKYLNDNFVSNDILLFDKGSKLYQSLPPDTKVLSSILERMVHPYIVKFAKLNNLKHESPKTQNTYPDNVLSCTEKHAVDVKSSYREGNGKIKGMTLGAYAGYFRDRKSNKNTLYPYEQYKNNLVVCVIYDRSSEYFQAVELSSDSESIKPILKNISVYVQPKWKIASKQSGSGNTKNIGSIKLEKDIAQGNGVFLSEQEFDDYWKNYGNKNDE